MVSIVITRQTTWHRVEMASDAGAIIFGNAREATQKCILNLHTATPTETYEHLAAYGLPLAWAEAESRLYASANIDICRVFCN